MKNTKILLSLFVGLIGVLAAFYVCQESMVNNIEEEVPEVQNSQITVEKGYLSFPDQSALDDYLAQVEESLDKDGNLKSDAMLPQFKSFQSLASKIAQVKGNNLIIVS
jgi:hypothetical protein